MPLGRRDRLWWGQSLLRVNKSRKAAKEIYYEKHFVL